MRFLCIVVVAAASAGLYAPAHAQSFFTGQAGGAKISPLGLPGQPAKDAFTIGSDGRLIKADGLPAVRLQSEVLGESETIKDILSRHNLADDDKTQVMLKALNPSYDTSKGAFPAGSKIDIFTVVPSGATQLAPRKYTFDSPNVTRFAFYTQAERASEISNAALRLSPQAFGDPSFAQLHVRTTEDIKRAAETLQTKSDKLSKLDVAVGQFQIELANKHAAAVNVSAKSGDATRQQVLTAAASAKAVKETADRVEAGKPATEFRNVQVNVFNGGTSDHVKPLQVYVLPSGALESRGLWSAAELEAFLNYFSFANEASPVAQDIPINFDPRVCVGPKNAVSGMAKLIAAGKLTTCRKPDIAAGANSTVLIFRSPDDVARP